MTAAPGVVIVGAGQAGFSTARALRIGGYDGPVTLVGTEPHLPYQRPPLSKKYLVDPTGTSTSLVGESFFADHAITLLLDDEATHLDLTAQEVGTRKGREIRYEQLVLATGARNRSLTVPGADLDGVHALRSLDDASLIGPALSRARDVVVIGGGFIGLELAQAALSHGADVHVLEVADRLLARVLSPGLAERVRQLHEDTGVRILTETRVLSIEGKRRVERVATDHGTLPADLVLYGIGAVARDQLARAAGLAVDDGIVVDEQLQSVTDPRVSAVGDCARHPHPNARGLIRLESVQNATDQGAMVGRRLAGDSTGSPSLPWFWSDQGPIKLQIAGLRTETDVVEVVQGPDGRLVGYVFRNDRLVAAETVNWAAEHLAARRLLSAGAVVDRARLAGSDLSTLARSRQVEVAHR